MNIEKIFIKNYNNNNKQNINKFLINKKKII